MGQKNKDAQVHAANETNASMDEVRAAEHDGRNSAQFSGEDFGSRDLREKPFSPKLSQDELDARTSGEQRPSDEKLEQWGQDQAEAKEQFENIRIAESIYKEHGADYFNDDRQQDSSQAPQSDIQGEVAAQQDGPGKTPEVSEIQAEADQQEQGEPGVSQGINTAEIQSEVGESSSQCGESESNSRSADTGNNNEQNR